MEDITKERILTSAEELFAEKGYDAVTIREITAKAQCNLSLVYYYFGGKRNLYFEVFRQRWVQRAKAIQNNFFRSVDSIKPNNLEGVIEILTTVFFEGKMEADDIKHHHQLMARELQKPTEALNIVFNEVMKPFFLKLEAIIKPFLRTSISRDTLFLSLFSIIAQIIHFAHSRYVIPMLLEQPFDGALKHVLIKHITQFSMHGMMRFLCKEEG